MKSTEDIILELKGEVIKLKEENNKLKKDKKDLEIKYINLRARYTNLSNEIILLKEGVVNEVNNRTSKRGE